MNILQKNAFKLQFITHTNDRYDYLQSAELALNGGCRWIQLRMKEAAIEEVERVALQLIPLCKEKNAVFILDDHVELCKKVGADGVHLGKLDMDPAEARKILGDDFIIGGTCNTFEDIENAIEENALNIAFGDFEYDEEKGLKIAKKIVKALKDYGFEINWGESVDEIIEIENFNWKKKYDGKDYSMDGALEDFIRLNSEENEQ